MQKDHVILVNERDEETGTMEKMEAHLQGVLHRAFSVFILNDKKEMLLQQRAEHKYHSPGLWSNACCSHPMPGETTIAAAHRRLKEELGFDCELTPLFHLLYRSDVGKGLTEHEFDHLFVGSYNGEISPDPEEVKSYRFISLVALNDWMKNEPQSFTTWFNIAMPDVLKRLDHL